MTKYAWWLAIATTVLAGGCQHTVYEVDMAVEGSEITRSINVYIESHDTASSPFEPGERSTTMPATQPASRRAPQEAPRAPFSPAPEETGDPTDLARIAALYKVDPKAPHPWKRTFTRRTPNDVGGAGQVAHFETGMGSTWVYVERFRGHPDPASALQARLKAAETLAGVIAGWARARLGDRKGFDKLGAYLDGDFRKELRNLSLLTWVFGAVRGMETPQHTGTPEESSPPDRNTFLSLSSPQVDVTALLASPHVDVTALILQYLVERKYVELEDAPVIKRMFNVSDMRGSPS